MINLILFVVVIFLLACGVKGKPQPPITPPLLGRGTPSFSKATESVKIPKNKKIEGDFDEAPDFEKEKDEK